MNRRLASLLLPCAALWLSSCGGGGELGVQHLAATTSCTDSLVPTWPASWQTMDCHGAPAFDPAGDASPAVIDAVGSTAFPAVQSAMDANFVYLRIRANNSVGTAGCTCTSCVNDYISDAHGWGYDFDTDGNPSTYEFQLLMNGASNASNRTLEFNKNLVQAGAVNSPNEKAETVQCIYAGADTDARVRVDKTSDGSNLGGTCDFYISMAFPLSELSKRGINMKSARLVWAGSSAQAQNLSGDLVCDNKGTPTLDTSRGDPTAMCLGGCCTQDSDCTAGRPTTLTVLTAPMTAAQTTATVASTAGYPTSGAIVIDTENLTYTGVTATTFTGLGRGALGSTAATHAATATVDDYFGEDVCNTGLGVCECTTAPDSCPAGQFCDPLRKTCRPSCTSAAPQGGACSTSGDMTRCCDDGNSCTTNACTAGKCVFAPTNEGVICNDYNACSGLGGTETATCNAGSCGSLAVACTDDGLACTADVCQPTDLACVHPLRPSGTVCRAALPGGCDVAETCDGTSTSCPADVLVGTGMPCDDSNACTSGETCNAGVCGAPVATVTCNMPPVCQSESGSSCNPMTGLCSYPNPTNGFPCTGLGTCNCATSVCDAVGNAAPGECEPINTCGNGVIEAGEGCDDGATLGGDGCNAACLVESGTPCGPTGNASCASGSCNLGGGAPGVCQATNVCGNGTLELGEGCDDSGTMPGDGCSATCFIESGAACNANPAGATGNASCASSVCDVSAGAPGTCEPANMCGNGKLEAGEGCDDGGALAGGGCDGACRVEDGTACNANGAGVLGAASCASGVCDTIGNAAPGVCEPINTCGNGTLEAGEGCDDGGALAGGGCNELCRVEDMGACNASAPGLIGNTSCASGVCDTIGNAAPGVCEPAGNCGNGTLEAGEGCDDGDASSGGGCDSLCRVEDGSACNASAPGLLGNASCASGVCDALGNASPGVCEPTSTCGNGLLEAGEGCDDGGTLGGNGCGASCLIEVGSACNANGAGATGNASCASNRCDVSGGAPGVCAFNNTCGNGVLEPGEGCDDNGTADGDGCSAACLVENNSACNALAPGLTGNASCASSVCDATAGAPGVCEPASTCGNGKLEPGEGCDDGGVAAADGCDGLCKLENGTACNANAAGTIGNASCDSGVCDTIGNVAPGLCEPASTCGNGKLEAGEGCDDGGVIPADGCSATCFVELGSTCNADPAGATGNGSCVSGVCDTSGNAQPGICEVAGSCGNGKLEAGEGCDDGGTTAGGGCDGLCKIELGIACNANAAGAIGSASCASGVCDTAGNAAPGLCEMAGACGNGVLEAGEGCDDGGTLSGDGCNASCKIENGVACNANASGATGDASCASASCDTTGGAPGVCRAVNACGNGALEAGEGCDDSGTQSGDGCTSVCLIEDGRACNVTAPGATGNASCASSVCNTTGGAPGVCAAANSCGNGKLEAGEACDDGGKLAGDGCDAACKLENGRPCTEGTRCASGVCDTVGNPAGQCEPANTCGNGKLEAGEACDDGNAVDGDGCGARCESGVGSFAGGGFTVGCSTAPSRADGTHALPVALVFLCAAWWRRRRTYVRA